MSVAHNIRRLRNKAGLTQEELATRIGVARTTVAQWENGSSHPRYAKMTMLAQVFGVSPADIVAEGAGTTPDVRAGHPATVPLVALGKMHADRPADAQENAMRVEVPSFVLAAHPHARAVLVDDDCMDRVVPDGMAAVFDPDLEPANGSIAIVETQGNQALMRRWYRGGNTLMLVADSHAAYDDIVIRGSEPVCVLGTVVFAQSPNLLG